MLINRDQITKTLRTAGYHRGELPGLGRGKVLVEFFGIFPPIHVWVPRLWIIFNRGFVANWGTLGFCFADSELDALSRIFWDCRASDTYSSFEEIQAALDAIEQRPWPGDYCETAVYVPVSDTAPVFDIIPTHPAPCVALKTVRGRILWIDENDLIAEFPTLGVLQLPRQGCRIL